MIHIPLTHTVQDGKASLLLGNLSTGFIEYLSLDNWIFGDFLSQWFGRRITTNYDWNLERLSVKLGEGSRTSYDARTTDIHDVESLAKLLTKIMEDTEKHLKPLKTTTNIKIED